MDWQLIKHLGTPVWFHNPNDNCLLCWILKLFLVILLWSFSLSTLWIIVKFIITPTITALWTSGVQNLSQCRVFRTKAMKKNECYKQRRFLRLWIEHIRKSKKWHVRSDFFANEFHVSYFIHRFLWFLFLKYLTKPSYFFYSFLLLCLLTKSWYCS